MDDDTNNSYECNDDDESEEFVSERLPTSNNVIRGQKDAYAVGKKIASGKYGAVYEVLRRRDGKMFAAKLEVCGVAALNSLNMDYVVLKAANKAKSDHFCNLVDRGMIQNHFKFLIINMLGDNLFKLRLQFQQHRFSAPTSLRLALQMLESLEQLHSLGYMHRDVKPSNFALFEDGQIARIILLDFGLCRHFKTASGGIKPPREKTQFRGTARYASLAAHREMEQSPKDDLESWFYVVVEFMTGLADLFQLNVLANFSLGDLPWSHFSSSERDSVKKAKEHARTLEGMYLRDLIILAMRNNDIRPDEPYDWEQQEVATEEAALTSSSTAKSDTKLTRMDGGRGGDLIRNGPVNGGLEQKQQQTSHQPNSNNAWR
uniref:Protein kinase domain-containing protein n=1 Tax=Globodera pallida TaxID=36090 RepID=A0A183BK37_GLOPA